MKNRSLKALFATGASALAIAAATPAVSADLDPIEEAKRYVEVGSFRGSILLPDTGISFKVGGYVKADFVFKFEDFAGGNGATSEQATTNGAGEFTGTGGDRTRFHANQSRINFDARTTTDLGSARMFLEWDLFNGGGTETVSNSFNPRLRLAFVELGVDNLNGSLLAGQSWTNFGGDLSHFSNVIEFNGPDAAIFIRQAQVRWTQTLTDNLIFAVSAENPEVFTGGATAAGFPVTPVAAPATGLDAVPDFTARFGYTQGSFSANLSGLIRYFDLDEDTVAVPASVAVSPAGVVTGVPATTVNASNDTAVGWAVSGNLNYGIDLGAGRNTNFNVTLGYGEGVGRYVLTLTPDIVSDGAGGIEAVDLFWASGYIQHFWTNRLQSNVTVGYATSDDAGLDSDLYAGLNLIYSPRSNINLGIEGVYEREELDGLDETDGFTVTTSVQFTF